MNINSKCGVLCVAVTLAMVSGMATAARADLTLIGSEAFNWQAFPDTITSGGANAPFWDNNSMDGGANKNVGNYIKGNFAGGLPGGSVASPNLSPVWWGRSNVTKAATSDSGILFSSNGPIVAQLRMEVAGYANGNVLGWYNPSDAVGQEVLHTIFTGPNGPGTTVTFTPSADFGLYIRTGGGLTFFTESNRNRGTGAGDLTTQHFATFASSLESGGQSYILGVEDLPLSGTGVEGIGDFNDMVFSMGTVPAPGAAALFGVGFLALNRRHRRDGR